MIAAETLLACLTRRGWSLFAGVPCSYLTSFINAVIDEPEARWVSAVNEGDAVAIAAGAELGGARGAVLCQNSGLGNAVSPLTSLNAVFRLPILLVVTHRGQPGGPADEPQHALMGRITTELLELMEIPWEALPGGDDEIGASLARAAEHMDRHGTPYALVVRKGDLSARGLEAAGGGWAAPSQIPLSADGWGPSDPDRALAAVREACARDVVVATTGFTGRALYALGDRPNHFYMVGSMGCAASFGLGLALARPDRRIVVVDGDGSLLMRMGALATIGHEAPANLLHVVLDNGVHDSTGGQATPSSTTDFAAVARACGYRRAARLEDPSALAAALAGPGPGPALLHLRTRPREKRNLPRPTLTPPEMAARLRRWMAEV